MHTFEAIEQRRSVKKYDPSHKMKDAEEQKLLSLIKKAPTAFNLQNTRFVLLKDKELKEKVRAAAWDQAQVTDSSLLIVICADLKAWKKDPARYWANAPQAVQDYMKGAIDNYYRGKERVERDEAMRSAGIAAQTIMLAAKAMGYETCPMDGFDFDEVGKLINLPEDHTVCMFVAVGKPLAPANPRPTQLPLNEVVITDRF